MSNSPRITMRDVAEAAGVSLMTVSRALRGGSGISLPMKERITQLADQLGYRPDPLVSGLMGRLRRSRVAGAEVLAWVTNPTVRGGWKHNLASQRIYDGALARAESLGYHLEEFWLGEPKMTEKRLSDILHSRGIRGVIVAPLQEVGALSDFQWDYFASVCCGYSLTQPRLHRAASHQFQAMTVAWEGLIQKGYRRIGLCLAALEDERVDHLWLGSFLAAQCQVPRRDRITPWLTDRWSARSIRAWFDQAKPEAVISSYAGYACLIEAEIRVPRDCGFADINHMNPKFAGVAHPMEEIGVAAVDLVVAELAANRLGLPTVPRTTQVECAWQPGPTVKARLRTKPLR